MEETVILTGGVKTRTKVTVYNTEGFLEDWPDMKQGRSLHGCGHFVNTNNQVVRL